MNATKFIAIAALATAFGGQAFAGSLSYNDGAAATKAEATTSSATRADVQSQTAAYRAGPTSLAYDVQVSPSVKSSQADAARSRDDVRAEAGQRSFSRSLSYSTGA